VLLHFKVYQCNNVQHSAMNLERICYRFEHAHCKPIEAVIRLHWHMFMTACHMYCMYHVCDKEMSCGDDKSMNKGVRLEKAQVMKCTHESHRTL
jgi:hypothetical protein